MVTNFKTVATPLQPVVTIFQNCGYTIATPLQPLGNIIATPSLPFAQLEFQINSSGANGYTWLQ